MTLEEMNTRLDTAAKLFTQMNKVVTDLQGRMIKAEANERKLASQISGLKTQLTNARNENKSADPFYVGLDSLRERDGCTDGQYDRLEILAEGKRIIAARTAPTPTIDIDDDDESPF